MTSWRCLGRSLGARDAWKEGIVSGLSRLPMNGVKALERALGPDVVRCLLKR